MPKGPRGRTTVSKAEHEMLVALKFVLQAQSDDPKQMHLMHARIADGWISASDGARIAGHPIDSKLQVCPHTELFTHAVKNAGAKAAIILLENGYVQVQGNGFKAIVPAIDDGQMFAASIMRPDPVLLQMQDDDNLKEALVAVALAARESSPDVITSSVCLASQTCYATNRHILIEAWHGYAMPRMVIPKASIALVCGQSARIVGIGGTERSVTFHYAGGAWIKSQLFEAEYPDVSRMWEYFGTTDFVGLPVDFFDAVDSVDTFADDDNPIVFVSGGNVRSHVDGIAGASANLVGMDAINMSANPEYVLSLRKHMTRIQVPSKDHAGKVYFTGKNVRAIVMQKVPNQ